MVVINGIFVGETTLGSLLMTPLFITMSYFGILNCGKQHKEDICKLFPRPVIVSAFPEGIRIQQNRHLMPGLILVVKLGSGTNKYDL